METNELIMLQSLPLDIKIAKTKLRIEEWIRHYGEDGCYISFSGGKDSTVLLDLVRQINKNIEAVFVDTGLEYPEIKKFVNEFENVTIIRPKLSFKQVIEKYGFPMISKENAKYLHQYRQARSQKVRDRVINGNKDGQFKLPKKYYYLLDTNFKISHKCCDIMKKNPSKKFEKESGKVPFIGTLAEESSLRKQIYLQNGCNGFQRQRPMSTPLAFWTEQDILMYIKKNNLKIAEVYGEIIEDGSGKLKCTKCDRTGCVFCGFGVGLERGENRYQRLKKTHPQLHAYCMDKLGFKEVCEYMGIKYENE